MADTARLDGTWETARKKGLYRRLRLRRADGQVYLDRWGIGHDRVGRVLLHRMEAPDPGVDLHDHPWWFVSIVLWGGYVELRAPIRKAADMAMLADTFPATCKRGLIERRRPGSTRLMRLDECHTITRLTRRRSWTLVIAGPRRRAWGFYLPTGWVPEPVYDATVRTARRDLFADIGVSVVTDNGPAEVDVVHVYCEPDDVAGESGWWIACADVLGRAAVDAKGRTPAEAFARLAEQLAERAVRPRLGGAHSASERGRVQRLQHDRRDGGSVRDPARRRPKRGRR